MLKYLKYFFVNDVVIISRADPYPTGENHYYFAKNPLIDWLERENFGSVTKDLDYRYITVILKKVRVNDQDSIHVDLVDLMYENRVALMEEDHVVSIDDLISSKFKDHVSWEFGIYETR